MQMVHCQPAGVDRYHRVIATCFKGSEDINQWMVANGWVVAIRRYSVTYVIDVVDVVRLCRESATKRTMMLAFPRSMSSRVLMTSMSTDRDLGEQALLEIGQRCRARGKLIHSPLPIAARVLVGLAT
jgi:hypothetical protein